MEFREFHLRICILLKVSHFVDSKNDEISALYISSNKTSNLETKEGEFCLNQRDQSWQSFATLNHLLVYKTILLFSYILRYYPISRIPLYHKWVWYIIKVVATSKYFLSLSNMYLNNRVGWPNFYFISDTYKNLWYTSSTKTLEAAHMNTTIALTVAHYY